MKCKKQIDEMHAKLISVRCNCQLADEDVQKLNAVLDHGKQAMQEKFFTIRVA